MTQGHAQWVVPVFVRLPSLIIIGNTPEMCWPRRLVGDILGLLYFTSAPPYTMITVNFLQTVYCISFMSNVDSGSVLRDLYFVTFM